ncbi:Uncharacterised protein [Candidatus Bartonella washoeensis]|uniref:Uncharacterized protein n=1 Tax=Candidatus Bartonella washoeensis Sb944nv TaxID=1094563 RepID=J0YVW8_9HYPH|nr:hypothetical protein MCQ_00794 [Bartonella washoeensis Sb944nv]SPU27978.1 Uncharacterised protein [Bartonella washoeensis]
MRDIISFVSDGERSQIFKDSLAIKKRFFYVCKSLFNRLRGCLKNYEVEGLGIIIEK